MTKVETAMLATLEANQVNIQQALVAHQEFTAEKFNDIAEVLKRIETQNMRIEIQTVKTNGRTTENEKDILSLKADLKPILIWKTKLGGIWFALLMLSGGIVGIAGIVIGIIGLINRSNE